VLQRLRNGRQWRRFLLVPNGSMRCLTYALSLSYFESEVLRPLLQGGCDDIWLIADAEGYRAPTVSLRRRDIERYMSLCYRVVTSPILGTHLGSSLQSFSDALRLNAPAKGLRPTRNTPSIHDRAGASACSQA
jgi:hypothetical protein